MRGPTYKLIMRKTCDYARAEAQIEKLITRNRPVRKLKTRRVTTRVVSSKEPTYCKFPCWSLSLCCELRAVATTNHTVRRLSFSTAEVCCQLETRRSVPSGNVRPLFSKDHTKHEARCHDARCWKMSTTDEMWTL